MQICVLCCVCCSALATVSYTLGQAAARTPHASLRNCASRGLQDRCVRTHLLIDATHAATLRSPFRWQLVPTRGPLHAVLSRFRAARRFDHWQAAVLCTRLARARIRDLANRIVSRQHRQHTRYVFVRSAAWRADRARTSPDAARAGALKNRGKPWRCQRSGMRRTSAGGATL